MKKINDWVIKTFGLRGSWSWAKKQMLNGAIIKRKNTNDYITSYPASLSDMSIKEKGDIVNDHFDDTIAIELHK